MQPKYDELEKIYAKYDAETADFRKDAVCTRGCAFCCKDAGSIDITTLEGWRIREHVRQLPRVQRNAIQKGLERDVKKREAGLIAPCPFLMKNKACRIYSIRPFACRRIYSLRTCSKDEPPMVSRRAMQLAQETIAALQRLDENGYSGHISFVLHMLDSYAFRKTYASGDFKPDEIRAFGKTHRIFVNKMAV